MAKFSKNIMKALAQQASAPGGISQAQEKTNEGYEGVADLLAKMLAAGAALQFSKDPAELALLEELTQGTEAWRAKVAAVLLGNGGAAVSGLLGIITNPNA